jgi:PAS domain S-box-containing protein
MNLLDMRTVIVSYTISNFICMVVMAMLWFQNRRQFAGLGFWLADFVMQWGAMLLVALRGQTPDLLSMTGSNALAIGGTILLYMGLERFTGRRGPQIHNAVLIGVFIIAHAYFVLVQPNLLIRTILFSMALLVVCAQCAWLLLGRVSRPMRGITRSAGIVLVLFCLISGLRLVVDLTQPAASDFFNSGLYDTASILIYQMLFIALTVTLLLMVTRRLVDDLNQDIAIRWQVEAALRLSEEKFSKAFQASPDSIIISRLTDGRVIEVNEGFTRLTGYSREEALDNTTLSLNLWVNLQDRAAWAASLQQHGFIRNHEYTFRIKSGRHLHCLCSGEIIVLNGANHVLSIVSDITERQRAEAIIHLRLRLLEFAADHTLEELMQLALDEIESLTHSQIGFYHIVEADQQTLTLKAWSTRTEQEFCKAEGKGMHYDLKQAGVWVDCVHQRRPVIHNDYAALPHRKGLPPGHAEVRRELVAPTLRAGRIVSVLGVGNKAEDYDEQDVELVSYVADVVWTIVERKQDEAQLVKYQHQLEAQNAELDAFAHTVAHDLKNPIGVIIGYSEILTLDYNRLPTAERADTIEQIFRMANKLDTIIEELMLLAGVRERKIIPEPLEMGRVVRAALERLQNLIHDQQAQVTLLDEAAWPTALGYAPWVEEVWTNYISNAIKYGGSPPQIEIGAAGQPNGQARFWVRDNGAGLDAARQATLFTPFTRLAQVHIEGHGLGLSIVRRIVEKLEGEVGVESAPGEGSVFFFTLPRPQ